LAERVDTLQRGLSSVAVDRLVRCHRLCVQLKAEGRESTSSQEIGESLGYGPSQVRRDLSRLGKLGTRGTGYRVDELEGVLGRTLGKGQSWNVVLVGAGDLGSALLKYGGFRHQGFRFVAVFDADAGKVGVKLGGLVVQDISAAPDVLSSLDADIGMIAVPAAGAQQVATLLAENGVKAILNFAPHNLSLGESVVVGNVDLTIELEKLSYYLTVAKTEGSGGDRATA
jgi:redox-sensing transcriptional repressor